MPQSWLLTSKFVKSVAEKAGRTLAAHGAHAHEKARGFVAEKAVNETGVRCHQPSPRARRVWYNRDQIS